MPRSGSASWPWYAVRRETREWNRRVNRDRVTIQWSFTRKQGRKKFGYKLHGHGTSVGFFSRRKANTQAGVQRHASSTFE
jgi:hypothetical protein